MKGRQMSRMLAATLILAAALGACLAGRRADAQVFAGTPSVVPRFFGNPVFWGVGYSPAAYWGGYGWPGYGYGWGMGGTAAGNYMMGASHVITSQADYLRANSEAMINYEEARSKYLENRRKYIQTYYQMREAHQKEMADKRERTRHSPEALAAAAAASRPRPLGPDAIDPVSGKINWPESLQDAEYAPQRAEIEKLFALRSMTGAGMDTAKKIHAATRELSAELRGNIQKLPAGDYMAARKFIDSLSYVSRT